MLVSKYSLVEVAEENTFKQYNQHLQHKQFCDSGLICILVLELLTMYRLSESGISLAQFVRGGWGHF